MASSELPLIGINGLLHPGEVPRLGLPVRYANAVLKAGGIPVAIPPVGGPRDVERLLARLDGLLLSGGDDFDTARIGLGPTHPQAVLTPSEKQDFDFELVRVAFEREIPVLGVCYGMQLLGLATGADLHQHVPEDRPEDASHADGGLQTVRVAPRSKLARVLGVTELEVVCRHHQALKSPGVGWVVSANSEGGMIEAVERPDHAFALGVQWHPELAFEGSANDRLFRGLVGAASLFASSRFATGGRGRS